MSYDDLGRVTKTENKVSNTMVNSNAMPAYKIISQIEYDALGQLKKKKLAPAYNNNAALEVLVYDYNIRGWLLGENRDFVKDINNTSYFGFDLGYDKNGSHGTYSPQYGGNISGTIWKSRGDNQKRKYDFTYDAVNRLTAAAFNQHVSGSGTSALFDKSVDFSVANLTYDANGNILSMNQSGLKVNASMLIDQLTYSYQPSTNKLSKVIDNSNDNTSTLGDFKYDAATKGATDYGYDANGNLNIDNNKKISGITYNHLNLPAVVTVAGKGNITYTYDAAGNKQTKETLENGAIVPYNGVNYTSNITTTTTYLAGFVYESKAYSNAALSALQYTDKLQLLSHEEGRIRYKAAAGATAPSLQYDYFLKDHLGNVRMVLTEEQQQDIYPAATVEGSINNTTDAVYTEQSYYAINTADVADKSFALNIPDYQNNNGNPPYNNNPNSNATALSQKIYKLNSAISKKGLDFAVKVMSGDRIDIFGKSYVNMNGGSTNGGTNIIVSELINTFAGTSAVAGSGKATATQLLASPSTTTPLNSWLQSQPPATSTQPKAFINWVLFDEQFKFVKAGISPVGGDGILKDHFSDLQNIDINKSGYLYVYCSNESPVNVFFDNLQVIHTRGALLEETHYYPFGLTMAGISSKAAGGIENKKKYNGIEFENDLDINTYDAYFRELDPQTGRWWQIDPKIEDMEAWSPYASNFDNPITFSDPLGDEPEDDGGCCGGGPNFISFVALEKVGKGLLEAGTNGLIRLAGSLNGTANYLTGGLFPKEGITGGTTGFTSEQKALYNESANIGQNIIGPAVELAAASRSVGKSPGMELAPVNGPKISTGNGVGAISPNGRVNAEGTKGSETNPHSSSRAAQRDAMRQEGIPTSQQPTTQKQTPAGRALEYKVPKAGGGTSNKQVQQQLKDKNHGPHWEAGTPKSGGQKDPAGRNRLQNGKSKSFYE